MRRLVLAALVLVGSAAADETPRISLLTFPPRGDLSGAFGHAALRIDADGDLATTSDQSLYDYGVWSMSDLQSMFSDWSALSLLVARLLDGEMEAEIRVRRDAPWQSASERLYEEGTEDVLRLPPPVLVRMRREIEAKFAPGADRTYTYNHYSRNCATELRDDVFRVLPERRSALQARSLGADASFRTILTEDLETAVAAHGRLSIAPGFWRTHRAIFTVAGVPETFSTAPEFFAMSRRVTERMSLLALSADRGRIRTAWVRFEENLDRAPLSAWDAAYTPARLRSLLAAEGLIEAR